MNDEKRPIRVFTVTYKGKKAHIFINYDKKIILMHELVNLYNSEQKARNIITKLGDTAESHQLEPYFNDYTLVN